MKGKYLLLSGMALVALSSSAQKLQVDYIEWPNSASLPEYIKNWTPGTPIFEDENFFISRVKPKAYFRNTATQVDETITEQKDKKMLLWVPVNYADWKGVHTDALPNGDFDSEVFSAWPYVTHYGDWTSPFGWVPGGFADAAHKHGTVVSGVASVPNATLSGNWLVCMNAMGTLDAEKTAKFLLYHGVDGLGYNSEWYGTSSVVNGLNKLHADVVKYMKGKNDKFENIWYTGTEDGGSINGFYDGLYNGNKNIFGDSENVRTSLFLNYNWNSETKINTSQTTAASLGRDVRDLYAGMNMQGSCKTTTEWLRHLTCGYSVGIWGAHSHNYLWGERNSNGSAPMTLQSTYQNRLEMFFNNGNRNPIDKIDVYQTSLIRPSETWFGISSFMSARSSLSWDLTTEPFITNFNLGNGQYFNYKGERQHNSSWYNLGVQDYMPTWRFWTASKFLGKSKDDVVKNGLDIRFSWNDAYLGGSSLRIKGDVADEYIHLFKTKFQLAANDVITVRYKLAAGTADISLALSLDGTESTPVDESLLKVMTTTQEEDDEVWVVKTFDVKQRLASLLRSKPLAMIALHVKDAKNLDLYLGEFSIRRGTYPTPATPIVDLTKTLANNSNGVDGKIIFHMPNNKAADQPCYNLDVNTSLFRMYAQQEGGEIINMGATSSWAGICFATPFDVNGAQRIRFGVSAVSLDFQNESEIAWGEWLAVPNYAIDETITLSKSTIKPGEPFTISYADPMHEASSWSLYDNTNTVVASASGVTEFEVNGIDKVGSYDLVVDGGTAAERRLTSFVLVSAWDKGALPEIHSVSVNGDASEQPNGVQINVGDEVELSYTGRDADGLSSRGITFDEKLMGVNVGQLGLESNHSFSVAAWVRLNEMPDGIYSFMTIENRNGQWPKSNWGYFWCRINQDGYITSDLVDSAFGGSLDGGADGYRLYCDFRNSRIVPMAWTHVCFVFEYNESRQIRYSLYINGIKQKMSSWLDCSKRSREDAYCAANGWDDFSAGFSGIRGNGGEATETGFASSSFPVSSNDWISFGGTSLNINAMDGVIDNVVIWNKAVTDQEVTNTMNGLDPNALPDDVLGFWDFDSDADAETKVFPNKSAANNAGFCNYSHVSGAGEGQASNQPIQPNYTSGCPFIDAKTYAITTAPTWTAKKATVTEAAGTATSGKAKVSYRKEGDYKVTLTLANELGSDSRDYPVLKVGTKNAIEGIANDNLEIYAVDKTIFVDLDQAGAYTVNVYNIAGELMNSRSFEIAAPQNAAVTMTNAAVYIVNIVRDGQTVRNAKVVVR